MSPRWTVWYTGPSVFGRLAVRDGAGGHRDDRAGRRLRQRPQPLDPADAVHPFGNLRDRPAAQGRHVARNQNVAAPSRHVEVERASPRVVHEREADGGGEAEVVEPHGHLGADGRRQRGGEEQGEDEAQHGGPAGRRQARPETQRDASAGASTFSECAVWSWRLGVGEGHPLSHLPTPTRTREFKEAPLYPLLLFFQRFA